MNFKEIKELLMLIDNTKLEYVKLNTSEIEFEVSKKVVGNIEIKSKISSTDNKEKNIEKAELLSNALENSRKENSSNDGNASLDEDSLDILDEDLVNTVEDKIEFAGENFKEVKAPLIGTFYESPDPDSPAFVSVGDHIEKGDTLCIVEAMKLMNEIKSEFTGKIVEINATNETMVEYGQTLFVIEED